MAEKYFCEFAALDVQPSLENGLTNVVKNIHWIYGCINEDKEVDTIFGVISIPEPNFDNFIPFEQLTQNEVENWLYSILNEESLKEKLLEKRNERLNPKIIQKKAPWNEVVALPPPITPEPVVYTNQEIREMALNAISDINDRINEINKLKGDLENLIIELNSGA